MLQIILCYCILSLNNAESRSELGPGSFCLDFQDVMEFSIDEDVFVSNTMMPCKTGLLNQNAGSRLSVGSVHFFQDKIIIFKQGTVSTEC